jgi:hypothetical protein
MIDSCSHRFIFINIVCKVTNEIKKNENKKNDLNYPDTITSSPVVGSS